MTTTVGTIQLIATIDSSRYKSGAKDITDANKQMENSSEKASHANDSLGSKLAGLAKTGLKTATVGVLALGGAIAGMTISGGIARALNIEDAQAKLRGLGHDANSVKNIMDNALVSVKGTAFGLGEAATTAAGAVAAGVKPGKELEGVLKTVANSAALAGTDMSEMGAIFNKVATSNKVQMDVINQLGDRGIPVIQFLAKELGKSAEETVKLASAGKINFATFEKAMRAGVGDAAVEMGKTTRGSWQNMLAALSRVGEKIVSGPIDGIRMGMGGLTKWIDANAGTIVGTVQSIADKLTGALSGFGNAVPSIIKAAKAIGSELGPAIAGVMNEAKGFLPILKRIADEVAGPLGRAIGVIFVGALKALLPMLQVALSALKSVANFLLDIKQVLVVAVSAWAAYRAAMIASNAVMQLQATYAALTKTQYMLLNGQLIAVKTSTVAQTIAQAALNTVMKLSPWGLLAAGTVALGTAIFAMTRQTDGATGATTRLNAARQAAKTAADNLKIAEDALKGAQLGAEGAAIAVERAQRAYNDAVAQYGPKSLEAREAAYNLKNANNDLANANQNVADKTKAAMDAEILKNRTADEAKKQNDIVANSAQNVANSYGAWSANLAKVQQEESKKGFAPGLGPKTTEAMFGKGIPGLAVGGPVSAGKSYLVGENRDGSINKTTELFVPNTSGRIINSKDLQSAIGKTGGGGAVTYNITANLAGVMAKSTSDVRDIGKLFIRAVNDELRAKQQPLIGGGAI